MNDCSSCKQRLTFSTLNPRKKSIGSSNIVCTSPSISVFSTFTFTCRLSTVSTSVRTSVHMQHDVSTRYEAVRAVPGYIDVPPLLYKQSDADVFLHSSICDCTPRAKTYAADTVCSKGMHICTDICKYNTRVYTLTHNRLYDHTHSVLYTCMRYNNSAHVRCTASILKELRTLLDCL
jgi:hypothetical protein